SYHWSPATALSDVTLYNPVASPATTTIYTVTITDSVGAQAKDTVIVHVRPEFSVSNDTTICVGNATVLNAGPCASYLWSPNVAISNVTVANPTVGPNSTVTYSCQCTGNDGCVGSLPVTVNILHLPQPSFTTVQNGLNVQFNNTTSN